MDILSVMIQAIVAGHPNGWGLAITTIVSAAVCFISFLRFRDRERDRALLARLDIGEEAKKQIKETMDSAPGGKLLVLEFSRVAKPLAKAFAPAKPAVKPAKAAQKAAPPEKPAKAPKPTATPSAKPAKPAKPPKVKKPKLVRDRFTATEDDMAVLRALKQRAGKLDMPVKKGTVLRAGVRALTALSDTALVALLKQVPALK